MTGETNPTEDPWAAATYAGNEREQLLSCSKWTFTEKVRWLEQVHRLSIKLEKARLARLTPSQTIAIPSQAVSPAPLF